MRFKNRYLLLELKFADGTADLSLGGRELGRLLMRLVEEEFGDFGVGSVLSSLAVRYFNALTGLTIVRVARGHQKTATGACARLAAVRGRAASLRLLHVGGTIQKCQRRALTYTRELLVAQQGGQEAGGAGGGNKRKRRGSGRRLTEEAIRGVEESIREVEA